MAIRITYDDALRIFQQLVERFGPDYVYPRNSNVVNERGEKVGCVNFEEDGSPSCVVGHLVWELGFHPQPGTTLFDDTESAEASALFDVTNEDCERVFDATEKAVRLCNAMQTHQDTGEAWGQALSEAIEETKKQDWAGESMVYDIDDDDDGGW